MCMQNSLRKFVMESRHTYYTKCNRITYKEVTYKRVQRRRQRTPKIALEPTREREREFVVRPSLNVLLPLNFPRRLETACRSVICNRTVPFVIIFGPSFVLTFIRRRRRRWYNNLHIPLMHSISFLVPPSTIKIHRNYFRFRSNDIHLPRYPTRTRSIS